MLHCKLQPMASRGESSDEEGLPDGPMMMADRGQGSSGAEGGTARRLRHRSRSLAKQVLSSSKRCWKYRNCRLLVTLLLGQLLSLLLCSTGVTSQLLVSRHSVAVPTTQVFLTYFLLGVVYGVPLAARSDFLTILKENWWKYIVLGVIDLEANYLVVLAYKYTNLTTVQLLDSFTIATVMVLSFFFLRMRYKIINFMGVALSIIGILALVLADIQGSRAGRGPNPVLGDLLCLGGSLLYAVSNVAQEFLVKNHSITEYLGLIGITGSIASAVQLLVLERKDLVRVDWNTDIGLLFLGFGLSQFLFYSIVPVVLLIASAVVFNLSLLTADIYTLILGLFLFHYKFSFFYVLSFILIILGVFIYNLRQPTTAKKKTKEEKEKEEQQKRQRQATGAATGAETPKMISGLRKALFESQTYEMSESREVAGNSGAAAKPKGLINILASKLLSKLPSPPTAADHSALSSSSRERLLKQQQQHRQRTFRDLSQEDGDYDREGDEGGFFGASKEGLIPRPGTGECSDSGSRLYGSVDNTPKKRTASGNSSVGSRSRSSCSPP